VLRSSSNARARLNPPNLNGYKLFFINGVLNNKEEARETKEKLEQMLNQKTVALEYNKNHMLGQLFDLWVHKVGELEVDKTLLIYPSAGGFTLKEHWYFGKHSGDSYFYSQRLDENSDLPPKLYKIVAKYQEYYHGF
jgi:hypothetical protein